MFLSDLFLFYKTIIHFVTFLWIRLTSHNLFKPPLFQCLLSGGGVGDVIVGGVIWLWFQHTSGKMAVEWKYSLWVTLPWQELTIELKKTNIQLNYFLPVNSPSDRYHNIVTGITLCGLDYPTGNNPYCLVYALTP